MSASTSPQVTTVLKFLEVAGEFDFEAEDALLADEFQYIMLPKSMGHPPMNRTEYFDIAKQAKMVFKFIRFSVVETIESAGKVVLRLTSVGETLSGKIYENEYVNIFQLSQDGKGSLKITSLKEFVDSAYTQNFFRE